MDAEDDGATALIDSAFAGHLSVVKVSHSLK